MDVGILPPVQIFEDKDENLAYTDTSRKDDASLMNKVPSLSLKSTDR